MSRHLAYIDFDGTITEIKDMEVPEEIPALFCLAVNLKKGTLIEGGLIQAALEGNENVAIAKYGMIYVSDKKVFYGRFE